MNFANKWRKKQKLAAPSRFYGDGGTIHGSGELDVEVHEGKVIAVWFRCQQLPFKQSPADAARVASVSDATVKLTGVEVRDA